MLGFFLGWVANRFSTRRKGFEFGDIKDIILVVLVAGVLMYCALMINSHFLDQGGDSVLNPFADIADPFS